MSRFRHTDRSKKLRSDSKTVPVPGHQDFGDGEDAGIWYRCWNCGFLCSTDRETLGGADDDSLIEPTAYTTLDQYGDTAYHCQGAAGADQATCEAAGGTWASERFEPTRSGGCPLCGTLNWRGDY